MDGLKEIDWLSIDEGFAAFMVVFLMPLTYSIATAIGAGFVLYPLLKLASGKRKEVHPLML